jgi:hypothetical protein
MNSMDNTEIITKLGEITQWQKDHERHDDERFTAIEETLANIPKRDELDEIVRSAITDTIFKAGSGVKMTIITMATLIGAIVVISGGFKWLLATIGFEYVVK